MDLNHVRHITAEELSRLLNEKSDITIVDVRETDELDICSIGALHIPLGMIDKRVQEIPREKPVIVHCKTGRRGEMAVLFLQQNHGFENLYNLDGGIVGFADEDASITIY